jgi:tRNA (mo5U34)-methyltransferase
MQTQAVKSDSYLFFTFSNSLWSAGIWFLPTRVALTNWLKRANFRNMEFFYDEALSVEEQRGTEWAPIRSLSEALNTQDDSRTIEGYPAPRRFYLKAMK